MIWVWIIVIVLAIIIESATAQLVSVWFALGGIVALVLEFLKFSVNVQVISFVAVSVVAAAICWPFARKLLKKTAVKTNADRYIGKDAIVTEDISNLEAKGQVKVDNQIWTARSDDDTDISKGETVSVLRIEGVKLIVKKK